MKTCTKCKETKDLTEYNRTIDNSSGLRAQCKTCIRVQNQRWKLMNKGKCKTDNAKWYQKNINILKKKHAVYWGKNSYKMKHWRLKETYKIGLDDWNAMLIAQKFCCAICDKHQSEINRPLCVDHDHKTGEVRGLLCYACNIGMGMLKDDYNLLDRASQYLKKSKIKLVVNKS